MKRKERREKIRSKSMIIPAYKKHLEGIKKSNPEKLERNEQRKIHKTLSEIIRDRELHEAVKKYGYSISFANGKAADIAYRGYSHLEIDPKGGLIIVLTELDNMADHGWETHDSRYVLYLKRNRAYFKQSENSKEIDAAKAMRYEELIACNIDYSLSQTSKSILESLEKALEKANYCRDE
jgi:hypothetical protein